MSKDYLYNIGDIANDSLRIVEKSRNTKNGKKSYIVSSIKYPEAPYYSMLEENIIKGQKDAYLSGRRIFEGNSLYSIEWIRPCITTNKIYSSTSEASKKTGINIGSISKACNNKIKYAGRVNEKPLYWKYIN